MELKTPVRLVLCDDHRIITDGLQRLLQDAAWVECVGTAASGKELLILLEHLPADIILLDLDMPGMDGAEAMQQVKDRWPRTKVIILTMHDGPSMVRRLMEQGADGYLLKTCGRDELLRAVQAVHEGNKHFSAEITESLLKQRRRSLPAMTASVRSANGNARCSPPWPRASRTRRSVIASSSHTAPWTRTAAT